MNTAATQELTEVVRRIGRDTGFDEVGITDVRPSEHAGFYRTWVAAGRHGSMEYLAREDAVARRADPGVGFPELRSAIVVALDYGQPVDATNPSSGVIARYALGRDYHKVMKQKLKRLLQRIESEIGYELPLARACVDTAPILERELAQRAGLGWQGRSTMLVNPRRGSYFFIGTLLTELELMPDPAFARDHCGTCSSCVTACPTGALLGRDENGAPVMDATRCISYLTIENRGEIPRELRPLMGNRIFGCDICQEVCPWNGPKFVQITREPAFAARAPGQPPVGVQTEASALTYPGTASPSLIGLLETALDEAAWDSFSRGSPIRRAGRTGFARNVCVGLGNCASPDAVTVLTAALRDIEPVVRSHAAWALGQIGTAEALNAVRDALTLECDAGARMEMIEALGLRSIR